MPVGAFRPAWRWKGDRVGQHGFGRITLDPAVNPAILDTLTWDAASLHKSVHAAGTSFWQSAARSARAGGSLPSRHGVRLIERSSGRIGNNLVVLGECKDGQHFIACFGGGAHERFEGLVEKFDLSDGLSVGLYPADSRTINAVYSRAAPNKLPTALGYKGRLGIGTRMSRLCFPGIWSGIARCHFAANIIQNSCRELNLLDNVLGAQPSCAIYYPGFGLVPEGHTGSTFEGLWLCGTVESLKRGDGTPYGADADHIMVKRGADGLETAKKLVDAARYYSFYTLDVSDLLEYDPPGGKAGSGDLMKEHVPESAIRRDLAAYYRETRSVARQRFSFDEAELSVLVAKYWNALGTVEKLSRYIGEVHRGAPVDLELSIDEHPPEIHAFDCITTDKELFFLLSETRRRGIPLTHVAPNFGVEKLVDYRYKDGLPGLTERVGRQHEIAESFHVMLDCHSGDDLSSATRRAFSAATRGQIHYKISPRLQTIFGEVVHNCHPEFFKEWWDDTVQSAEESAREGSEFARKCLADYRGAPDAAPDPKHVLFTSYCFATVGKRDPSGRYVHRDKFYSLSRECGEAYEKRIAEYLCALSDDLFYPPVSS